MKKYVSYLCPYLGKETGLVFPDELAEGEYSPGLYIIEENNEHQLDNSYNFHAVQAGTLLQFNLEKVNQTHSEPVFLVKTPLFGTFYFRVYPLSQEMRYIGQYEDFKNHYPLWLLECMDDNRLEILCQKADFFFVGMTPASIYSEKHLTDILSKSR